MKDILKKDGASFILASLIILTCMPQIFCAFVMFISNTFLTNFGITIANTLSYIIAYLLFILGLSKVINSKNKYIDNIINGIPLIIGYEIILLFTNIFNIFGLDNILIFNIIHMILNGIILTLTLYLSISLIKTKTFDINIKNIILIFISSLMIYFIPELVVGLVIPTLNNVLVESILNGLLYSVLVWIYILISLLILENKMINKLNINIPKWIIILIASLLFVLLFTINSIDNKNNIKTINNMISYSIASGDNAFDEMDIIAAKQFYDEASNIKCAYEYIVDDSIQCESDLYKLFKSLNKEDSIEILKELINTKTASYYDLEALVILMRNNNDPELGKAINYLISQMHFTKESVLPFDIKEEEKTKLKENLYSYDKHIILRKYIDIYTEWLNQGTINSTVVSKASSLARAYPDELGLQANTIKFYLDMPDNLNGDSIVVDNFVKLTKEEISKRNTDEIIAYKTYVVVAYQACNANSKAIDFLESYESNIISADLGALLVKSYKKNGNYQKAYDVALNVLKKDEYNVDALSFLSIYTLQSDLDESLEYASKLVKVISDKKDNYLGADIALGIYRLYLLGNYNTPDSNFCPYKSFFNEMTDSQKNVIYNNEILNAYLIGRNLNNDNISIINDMIKKYDYVSYFYYYRGVYELNNKEFEKAVEDISKAIELGNRDPFFYSELGFAYEGIGNLKKSLEAFEKASNVIDELNLGSITYNYNNIHNYFNVYINNAKHALYESEGDH